MLRVRVRVAVGKIEEERGAVKRDKRKLGAQRGKKKILKKIEID